MMCTTVAIPLSKRKTLKFFIFAIIFTVLGSLFILSPKTFIRATDTFMITLIGYVCIVFFGFCSIYAGMKLFDKKSALVIDEEGIQDNSSGVAASKILWKDVKGVYEETVSGQRFIMIDVRNPKDYLTKEKNPIKRRMMELNFKLYGTPIHITANALKISYDDLLKLIIDNYAIFKN